MSLRPLSEPFQYVEKRWSHALSIPHIETSTETVTLKGEWTTANRESPFFREPRLILDFGGPHTYLIDSVLLSALEKCAESPDGKFMLNLGGGREQSGTWIEAAEVGGILAWLKGWLARLKGEDHICVWDANHRDAAYVQLEKERKGWVIYAQIENWTFDAPSEARECAEGLRRASDIAEYLNILASKPKEASP